MVAATHCAADPGTDAGALRTKLTPQRCQHCPALPQGTN